MSPKRKSKVTLRVHADPRKIRRVWKIKPQTRVTTSAKRKKLERLREKETREE